MKYAQFERNHVIWPGRETALRNFLNSKAPGLGKHKLKHANNSHSEDALTWSCFDVLAQLTRPSKLQALKEIWEDAFDGQSLPAQLQDHVEINVGKRFCPAEDETTEVDASFESARALVFIEAKLYHMISPAEPPTKPNNQIGRKLRVGLLQAHQDRREFFFIWLDVAPLNCLYRKRKLVLAKAKGNGFHDKWQSAYLFKRYKSNKGDEAPTLRQSLIGIENVDRAKVAERMGWLTWADLFKTVLRAVLKDCLHS